MSRFFLFCLLMLTSTVYADDVQILRSGEQREWETFPVEAPLSEANYTFQWNGDSDVITLRISQENVKQRWDVLVNDEVIGALHRDENPMAAYWEVDNKLLEQGENIVRIHNAERKPRGGDDIGVGRFQIFQRPLSDVLRESQLVVNVADKESGECTPARITILNADGDLQTVGADSDANIAVRPGTIYTKNGTATFGLPAGDYTIYAGRGFEYSLEKQEVTLTANEKSAIDLTIERQVDTTGFVACDTHVHTLTHSGHGDSTVQERMITLAAEGIELPIATDHNVQVDHEPYAENLNVRQYFTPVAGNEYTTPVGHFNIFPARPEQPLPNHRLDNWPEIFAEIENTTASDIVILNHARDLHSGVRPFGPENYFSLVGENLHGWPIGFNAMEVVNSGATQTDPLQLFQDWMNLLNAGHTVAAIGSSDSHDVSRHFVGQGRTYIPCDDSNPAKIDISKAIEAIQAGETWVSYGLFTTLSVKRNANKLEAEIAVSCPDWITADELTIYANGVPIQQIPIEQMDASKGRIWQKTVAVAVPSHDTTYVAIATGPGITAPYWRTALPYQPDSISTKTYVIGCSAPVKVDVDNNAYTSPVEIAKQVWNETNQYLPSTLQLLKDRNCDQAVVVHVAHLYTQSGGSIDSDEFRAGLKAESPAVKQGFQAYADAWRETQIARLKQ